MSLLMNNEEKTKRPYKIMLGDVVTIYRSDYQNFTFYKVKMVKKNVDGTFTDGWKNVRFPKDVDIPDGTKIRIIDMFEDFYNKDKYTTIFTLFINEHEVVDVEQSYAEYESVINGVTDEDLPF